MIFPLRFRSLGPDRLIFANDAGDFFFSDDTFLERYAAGNLTPSDRGFLSRYGHAADQEDDFFYLSYLRRLAARHAPPGPLTYIILVPTLRCNLSCTYCQVSRVEENAAGFDWNEETLAAVIRYLDSLETGELKIEFQGGEPLLRPDLLNRVYEFCELRFDRAEFVVCTNLHRFGPEERALFERPNFYISTSLDGDALTHERNRTHDPKATTNFFSNLGAAIEAVGPDKVSALPTIDYANPPDIDSLIDAFEAFGLRSIYLRPVNYHGFARKAHRQLKDDIENWNRYYFAFIDRLIERNYAKPSTFFDEFYFTLCLNRILKAGQDFHVDLRNPNWFAHDYVLIDYDGTFYPTDEARMITRVGQIDLSIGNVNSGVDDDKVAQLNRHAFNDLNENCIHCAYQPYCGTDIIDDLSRYGRIDVNKLKTWFCRRHMAIFDRMFSYIYSDDPKVRFSLLRWAGIPGERTELGLRHHDTADA